MLSGRDRRRVATRRWTIGPVLLAVVVVITGLGIAPSPAGAETDLLTVTPNGLYLGIVPMDTVVQREMVATNDGAVAVTVTGVRFEPHAGNPLPTQWSIVEDECSATLLAPGASCLVTVAFVAVDYLLGDSGYLVFEGEGAAERRVPLLAVVATPGWLWTPTESIGAGEVKAGSVGDPATVKVRNSGTADAQVGEAILTGPDGDDFRIVDDGCSGALLVHDETCTITVVFAPKAAGPATAALEVPNDGAAHPVVALSGSGLAPRCEEHAVAGHGAVVRLVYLELLGRCPDAAGFAYWVGRLNRGVGPEAFAGAISETAEALGVIVDDAYRTLLDRPADPAGRDFWVGQLRDHGRYERLLADLAASPEFWERAGSFPGGFVGRIYNRLLDRRPDSEGFRYWSDLLGGGRGGAGVVARWTMVASLATLDEPLGRLAGLAYGQLLGRVPTVEERSGGIAFLRATGRRSGLYAQLIGLPEFALRAESWPD